MKLPPELAELSDFEIVELLHAMRTAIKYRDKNKFNFFSHESQINTYTFKWTDKNCLHLVRKDERK